MNNIVKRHKDGQVAVLYSSGYGSGWSTWNDSELKEQLMFDPNIVDIVQTYLDNKIGHEQMQRYVTLYVEDKYKGKVYNNGVDGLDIAWVPVGAKFRIEEYDGSETVICQDDYRWFVA